MKKLPDAMIITDPKKEYIAIKEASGSVDITVQIGVFIFMAALCFLFGFIIKRCVNPTSK